MPRSVLFIFEGEKTEVEIYRQLKKDFSKFDSAHVYATFNTNIYKLYDELKQYGFNQDLISLITFSSYDNLPDDFSRDFFTEVYLFFDYDGHADIANDKKLTRMLTHFNDETDEGKLYISYPMAEALKHIESDVCFKNTTTSAKEKVGYKQLVSQVSASDYMHITRYDLDTWHRLIRIHGMKLNFIVNEEYSFPSRYISQEEIFTSQLHKYIAPSNNIAVLSAFPILIIDYYGADAIHKRIDLKEI